VKDVKMNYENDLDIDIHSLDEEWLGQSVLFMRYAEKAADAKKEVDEAKQRMEITEAEIDSVIRHNPDEYDVNGKLTETIISKAVALSEAVQKATEEYIDAKHQADILSRAVVAFDHRKKALENLVYLHGQSYFSSPRPPEGKENDMVKKAKMTRHKKALQKKGRAKR
jgi:hypothetical protein